MALCFNAANASRVSNEKLHLDNLSNAEVVGTTRFLALPWRNSANCSTTTWHALLE